MEITTVRGYIQTSQDGRSYFGAANSRNFTSGLDNALSAANTVISAIEFENLSRLKFKEEPITSIVLVNAPREEYRQPVINFYRETPMSEQNWKIFSERLKNRLDLLGISISSSN
jgi:hypothetical protein